MVSGKDELLGGLCWLFSRRISDGDEGAGGGGGGARFSDSYFTQAVAWLSA
jgi:hypothetical protein